jgi:histidyl-tRNA synthetase
MEELDLFPSLHSNFTQVLFVNFGDKEADYCLRIIKKLRGRKKDEIEKPLL